MHVNNLCINFVSRTFATERTTYQRLNIGHIDLRQCCSRYLWTVVTINYEVGKIMKKTQCFSRQNPHCAETKPEPYDGF